MTDAGERKLERARRSLRITPTYKSLDDGDEIPVRNGSEILPVHEADKEILWTYDEEMEKRKQPGNHGSLLDHALMIARYRSPPTPNRNAESSHEIPLPTLLEEPSAARQFEGWVLDLHTEEGNRIKPKTGSHFRNTIRQFGEVVGDQGRPQHIENIDSVSPRQTASGASHDPTLPRSEIRHWDGTVTTIADSPRIHARDSAIVTVQWDAGTRPSELWVMRAKHLTDQGRVILYDLPGSKTKTREISLHASLPYFRKWLLELDDRTRDADDANTPYSIPPEQPIWTHQDSSEGLSLSSLRRIPRRQARRLGIDGKYSLKTLRKSRASVLAAHPEVTEQDLRVRFGWEYGSTAPGHYIQKFSDQTNQRIANADGASIEIAEEWEDPAPVQCSNCDQWSPNHLESCIWCGSDITGNEEAGTPESNRINRSAKKAERSKHLVREIFEEHDIPIGGEHFEMMMHIAELMENNPGLTKESMAFALATDGEIDYEEARELIPDDDTGFFDYLL